LALAAASRVAALAIDTRLAVVAEAAATTVEARVAGFEALRATTRVAVGWAATQAVAAIDRAAADANGLSDSPESLTAGRAIIWRSRGAAEQDVRNEQGPAERKTREARASAVQTVHGPIINAFSGARDVIKSNTSPYSPIFVLFRHRRSGLFAMTIFQSFRNLAARSSGAKLAVISNAWYDPRR
jgi:hypothetical protein